MAHPTPSRPAGLLIAGGIGLALALAAAGRGLGSDAVAGCGGRAGAGAGQSESAGPDGCRVATPARAEPKHGTPLPTPAVLRTGTAGWGAPARQVPPPHFIDPRGTGPTFFGHATGVGPPGASPAAGASARLHVLLCVWLN